MAQTVSRLPRVITAVGEFQRIGFSAKLDHPKRFIVSVLLASYLAIKPVTLNCRLDETDLTLFCGSLPGAIALIKAAPRKFYKTNWIGHLFLILDGKGVYIYD